MRPLTKKEEKEHNKQKVIFVKKDPVLMIAIKNAIK